MRPWLVVLVILLCPPVAAAHEVRPAYLQIRQTGLDTYDILWKVPARGDNLRLGLYVELPTVGDRVEAGNACAVVESVKAASDVYSPVTGKVVEVNAALSDKPETINEDAYGDGWIFVIEAEEPEQLNELLDPDAYAELLEDEDH